ncbi:hypothetical protein ACFL0M_10140 [Thermodesulfobacteriota bacterium]
MNRPAVRFDAMLSHLDDLFHEASTTVELTKKEILLAYLVIKLHDQWNFRSRQVVQISYGKSQKKMIEILRYHWSTKKYMNAGWEPDWHIPNNAIRAGRLLNIPNLSQVQNALGAVTYIDDIRWTRNAIVHNIPTSFSRFHSMTLSKYFLSNIKPSFLPLEMNPITGNSVYEDWCTDLSNALHIAL